MTSDESMRQSAQPGFKQLGTGHLSARECWGCRGRFMDQRGGTFKRNRQLWFCAGCSQQRRKG